MLLRQFNFTFGTYSTVLNIISLSLILRCSLQLFRGMWLFKNASAHQINTKYSIKFHVSQSRRSVTGADDSSIF
jgi:hypothetical protein